MVLAFARTCYIEFTAVERADRAAWGAMYSFVKNLQKEEHTRRYTIRSTASGWEVREEQDHEILRRTYYQDWHRVERARLGFRLKLDVLRQEGWREI
jgi:hypothetical protein